MTLEIRPARASHTPGDEVELIVTTTEAGKVTVSIIHLDTTVALLDTATTGGPVVLRWQTPRQAPCGYGVDAILTRVDGEVVGRASTGFDVLDHWTDYPRYGFFSDFPENADPAAAVETLVGFHVNAIQFYDWQYRHDQLVAPTDSYQDPLGRTLSLATVSKAIEASHASGIGAMAYVAVYGASARFWSEHPAWALYDPATGDPIAFGEDFLGLMDPTRGTPWAAHLLGQCRQALDFGFDGIHIDQYGEPRQAANASGQPVDLPLAFADFVDDLKQAHPGSPVTMNAVKNWPIESLAASPQDFVYIELWPDTPTYQQVLDVVLDARRRSGKPVVVAMYLPADHPVNVTTLDAVLTAAGAWRIEVGEQGRLLTDPYFPNHQPIPRPLEHTIRRHNAFAVRFLEVCGPSAHHDDTVVVTSDEAILAVARSKNRHTGISLVNLPDPTLRWDQAHPPPPPVEQFHLDISGVPGVESVWYATPQHPSPKPLAASDHGDRIRIELPGLEQYGLIWFESDRTRQ